ncbi:replication protein [Pantoea piersonii]|uniref:replication protein n=1 Tax=Pantoea piersonii TaxID=2364647 RepID=UPI00289B5464|nr:replication protein [Pantoea piersonii]
MNLAYDNVSPIRPELRAVERRVAELEDGYAKLSNMLLEEYAGADLTKRQFKVLLAILRKTYGWNKPMDRISDSQIAEIARLPVKRCNEAKLELVRMGLIRQQGGMYGPNKNVSEWCVPQNEGISPKTREKTSLKLRERNPSKQGDTKDTITKDKKDIKHTSENSHESSDEHPKNLPVVRPDAAVHSPKGDKWGTADDLLAAQWIFSRVQVITPTAQEPNWPAWANDIRLMRVSLTVSHREICEVFTWANSNQFWQTNILSPLKLRKQWATLKAQMSQPARNAPSSSQHQVPHWNDRREWEENFI